MQDDPRDTFLDHDAYGPRPRAHRPRRAPFPWALAIAAAVMIFVAVRPDLWLERLVLTTATPRAVTPRGDLGADEKAQIEIFESAQASVVFVTNIGLRRDLFTRNAFEVPQGSGSGFVWDDRGHIVTNLHVIANASAIEVALADGSRHAASLVGVSPDEDLAVLRIRPGPRALAPIAIGTSKDLKVGQKVYAIGNPFGLDHTMTSGIVSALGREIKAANGRTIQDVIQTDAAINPGNSGGPLLDSAGRLIGVNTAIYSTTGSYAGVGFAVPVDTVNRVIPQIIQHGRKVRPTLGVQLVPEHVAARLGVQQGVLVERVLPGTGAERAGLRGTARRGERLVIGDVIVAVGDRPVRRIEDLLAALEGLSPGQKAAVAVLRDGERITVTIELGDPG